MSFLSLRQLCCIQLALGQNRKLEMSKNTLYHHLTGDDHGTRLRFIVV